MKKVFSAIFIVALCMSLFVGCSSDSEDTQEFDIGEYKGLVGECRDAIYGECLNLSNIARYEASYWKSGITLGTIFQADSCVESAMDWFSDETGSETTVDDFSAAKENIDELYYSLPQIDSSNTEVYDIHEDLLELLVAYHTFYDCVLSPSGSYDSFVGLVNELQDRIVTADDTLELRLGQEQ